MNSERTFHKIIQNSDTFKTVRQIRFLYYQRKSLFRKPNAFLVLFFDHWNDMKVAFLKLLYFDIVSLQLGN